MIFIIIFGVLIVLLSTGIYLKKSFEDPIGETIRYDDNLHIYPGGGCNSIILRSDDGEKALIVDTKYFKGAKAMKKDVTANDITIVNTHYHMDHTRGNKLYPDAYVISGTCSWKHWDFDSGHSKRPDKVLNAGEEITFDIGDEKVHVINIGNAHTSTECIVYLENRKVLISGDIIWVKIHPMVLDSGCSIISWLHTLKNIEEKFDIKTLVPGHGSISDKSALTEMIEYFQSIMDACNDSHKLKKVKRNFNHFKSIPVVCNINHTVNKIKKEKAKV